MQSITAGDLIDARIIARPQNQKGLIPDRKTVHVLNRNTFPGKGVDLRGKHSGLRITGQRHNITLLGTDSMLLNTS